ncbi:MAG TPA: hypothetical protein DDY32_08465 [Desulfobulbaceae bacterium]|nr:hypothetical protein [Desulfobulbaceae bacterium]
MKKRIKDILQPELFAVPPDTPASLVMDIMREKNISCIVITEDDKPIGIFTERDIVRCIGRSDPDFAACTIALVMTRDVHSITPETMLYEAFSVLTENHIRHLVVVGPDQKALGVITQSDLLDHFEYDYLEKGCTVGQIMNKGIVTADPYDAVSRAAKAMADGALSFLIVCRQLQPLGVITERDMARFAAEGMDLESTMTQDVMSTPVQTAFADQPAFKAAEKMHEYDIRHLVVVNGAGKAIGVVTQTDLVRGLEHTFIETLRIVAREQADELAKTRLQLAEKTLCLDAILNSAINAGIAITDPELRVCHLTHSAEFILGITADEVVGKDIRTLVEHRNIPYGRLEQAVDRIKTGDTYTFTMQRRENNLARIIQATLSGIFDHDTLAGFLLILDDVTEKRITEETMHRLAYYDALTGLANRSMFSDKLKSELARSRRNDTPFALLLIDVDNFRSVNTTLSHQAGDRLLREIARRIDGLLRESDTVARLGSDEFCIILVSTGTTGDALTVANKIVKQLSPAYDLNGTTLAVNFSLGVAMYPMHGEDEETLLRNAGMAINQAKSEGKTNRESNIVVA